MSKFLGRRFINTGSGSGGDGYNDHGLLNGLGDDDHSQYLITSAVRSVSSPTSGLVKTSTNAGDVFTLENAGTGAALFVRQIGTTTDADAAVDIDNTGNTGRGLSVTTSTADPSLPLAQFTALNSQFDEPVVLITHANSRGEAIRVTGDGYLSGALTGPLGISMSKLVSNPFTSGTPGIYFKDDDQDGVSEFFFVDETGFERTFADIVPVTDDELVKVSSTDGYAEFLSDKLVAGDNISLAILDLGDREQILISADITDGGDSVVAASDGYFPFIEVDELEVSGDGSGIIANTTGTQSVASITRQQYNQFLMGAGDIEIKGVTLRTFIDADITPEITYTVVKNADLITDDAAKTLITNGEFLFSSNATTSETFITGNRKDGEIQFTTGALDFDSSSFSAADSNPDGYFYFIFEGDHTLDSKTVVIERRTLGPFVESISFEYPICSFTGDPQTAVRAGQSFDVTVTTNTDAYAAAVDVTVTAGDAVQSNVTLSETSPGSGIFTGTVVARTGQPNGFADINVEAVDSLANSSNSSTSLTGDALVLFDNDFPVIESFDQSDLLYPAGQTCLKYGEFVDGYMTVSDFTEILYSSPNGRISINDPTNYSEAKRYTWDQGASGIEENVDGPINTTNARIRARKASNCSTTTRDIRIRLDDTPPRITQIRWRRNNVGGYNLTSPTLGVGTHGVRFIFDDELVDLPEIIVKDPNKGTLSSITGTVPGDTFFATLTVTDPPDTNGDTEFELINAVNCSAKLPLDPDPINGTQEEFSIDVLQPLIATVDIDVDIIDGYFNDGIDGYDGYNVMNDDSSNLDNTEQGCEHNFSTGVMTITGTDILTRHNEDVFVTVQMNAPIESGDSCIFDASPWGASSSLSVPQIDTFLYQTPFTTNLGSSRTDDQSRDIGRASIWHATGGNATVTDLALNSDVVPNTDELSANGMDDVASGIPFTSNGTASGTFQVSTDSFRAFMIGRSILINDDNSSPIRRTVTDVAPNGTITCDGGSLTQFTTGSNAFAVPLSVTDAEIAAWDANNGIIAYVNDGAFTNLTLVDWANPEAFSQHLTNDQLTQNNPGTVGVDLFEAAFWGSKLSIPNTNGGTEDNPTGVPNSRYVWRSKKIRLTTNPTGVQGTNLRFMIFGFSAGTGYRNVSISSTSDWDQNANKFDLGNNDGQIEVRISTDIFASTPPYTNANWYLTTDFEVSPQSGFKFGRTKDINLAFNPPSTDIIDRDIYVEITLITNSAGKAPQLDMMAFAYLT